MLVDKAVVKAERKQKNSNPEAVLRKRAKKREKYIAKLISEGELSFDFVIRGSPTINDSISLLLFELLRSRSVA